MTYAPAWDVVYQRLLSQLPSITGLPASAVFDGPNVPDKAPVAYIVIGSDGSGAVGSAGSYELDYDDTTLMAEQGTVNLLFSKQAAPTAGAPALRADASALIGQLVAALKADKTFGVLPKGSTVRLSHVEPAQGHNARGAVVQYLVTVSYFTRQ